MTEGENVEYIGIGKPEVAKETHPAVKAVKGALAGWWERVGPGGVEKSWVAAHKNILKHIEGEDRKKAFEKSAEGWRRTGKIVGVASTVVDFSIGGLGIVLMGKGLRNLYLTEGLVYRTAKFLGSRLKNSNIPILYANLYKDLNDDQEKRRLKNVGRLVSVVPGAASLGILLGAGPAHMMGGIGAKVVELFGTAGAHGGNYVASGKASEHAKAVGGALGKGAEAAVKYAAEHPEEIRKTLRTVDDISRQRKLDEEYRAQTQKLEAERQLQREYNMWMDSLDGSLRSYYEQNHQWPPPMADFMKEREGFLKGIAQKEAAKKKKAYV
ncbi:MAG: hypothetical protein AAB481_01560 [Patescibacteria group bacterium]